MVVVAGGRRDESSGFRQQAHGLVPFDGVLSTEEIETTSNWMLAIEFSVGDISEPRKEARTGLGCRSERSRLASLGSQKVALLWLDFGLKMPH